VEGACPELECCGQAVLGGGGTGPKPASNALDDSWYFTAIDVRTRWTQRTGNGIQWNNHYASIYLGPDGAAYMPVLSGLIRFADGP